jgi:hypothetical protein
MRKIQIFLFLLKKNYNQFRKDLKDYSKIDYYANEMSKHIPPEQSKNLDEAMARLKKVRELAQKNYDPEKEKEYYEKII